MKTFQFRLERVLAWRGTELARAEAKGEQLKGGLRAAHESMVELVAGRARAQATTGRSAILSGEDLAVLDRIRIWTVREEKRLAARVLDLEKSIEAQNRCVANARRGVKLVERLRERKHQTWKAESDHEIDELAGESAIAQWRRLHT